MESEDEKRHALYKDPDVERFLTEFSKRDGAIEPEFDLTHGYRYPEVEKVVGKDPEATKEFLEKLAHANILEREVYDTIISCPNCHSPNASTQYICPFCDSPKITKNAVIEHIACGYIDNLTAFKADGNLVCPKCGSLLTPGSYRSAGTWYECLSCGKRIETLRVLHLCRSCKNKFSFDSATYDEAYAYSLSKTVKKEAGREIILFSSVKDLLKNLECNVQIPGRLKGESGIEHEFDIVAIDKQTRSIAIDVILSDKSVSKADVVREYAKFFDVKAEAYLMIIPQLDKEAGKLANSYKMNVVEAVSPAEALSKLEKMLKVPKARRTAEKEKRGIRVSRRIVIIASAGAAVALLIISYLLIPEIQSLLRPLLGPLGL